MEAKRGRGRPPKPDSHEEQVTVRLRRDLAAQLDDWRGSLPRAQAIRVAIERLVKTKPPKS